MFKEFLIAWLMFFVDGKFIVIEWIFTYSFDQCLFEGHNKGYQAYFVLKGGKCDINLILNLVIRVWLADRKKFYGYQ